MFLQMVPEVELIYLFASFRLQERILHMYTLYHTLLLFISCYENEKFYHWACLNAAAERGR